jgi:AmmeMemoRadiSam system protein B/AmmeMemoRadiSam system protein A
MLATGLVLLMLACASGKEATMIRQAAVAGQFYPADAVTLGRLVDSLLADANGPAPAGRVVAIQVPHAGYPFSGPTAAAAFRLLNVMGGATAVVVGTSHQARIDHAAVYAKGNWKTPLGDVPVDDALAAGIIERTRFARAVPEAHLVEHSIEVQLPFLQRAMADLRIVPIMVLHPSYAECEELGSAIATAARGRNVVLVASTDLYHGYSYEEAKRVDSLAVSSVVAFDPSALYDGLAAGSVQACGGYALVATMIAARELGAERAVLLAQTNSNDVMQERGGYCVGYSAVAFVAPEPRVAMPADGELTEAEQRSLLEIARSTLEGHVRSGRLPDVQPLTPRLAEPRGVFVTLHEGGELRGCIGYVEAVKPTYEAVREMAVAAATEDPRFPPVRPDELAGIDIEVTVLSPLRMVSSPDSVFVGRHGLVIRSGSRSGLLLPQVPVEQGWTRQQFLEHTCLKAGLARNAYKDPGTKLFVFTGQVFGEGRARR